MEIHLLSVPYDTARREERMGAGPEHLLRLGAEARLGARGHRVHVERIEPSPSTFPAEIATAFALQRGLASSVRRAVSHGAFPIVLSGNCNVAAVGTIAGLGPHSLGVLWFDSHGDFNTPETTIGGFLDGMALAMVTGRCWRQLVAQVPGFEPVDERDVLLLGARDLDRLEATLLEGSSVTVLSPSNLRTHGASAIARLGERVRDAYVHIDLDVLDPATEGRANALAAADGLTLEELTSTLRHAARHVRIAGAALTAYDPSFDGEGRVCRAALALLETLVDLRDSSAASTIAREE